METRYTFIISPHGWIPKISRLLICSYLFPGHKLVRQRVLSSRLFPSAVFFFFLLPASLMARSLNRLNEKSSHQVVYKLLSDVEDKEAVYKISQKCPHFLFFHETELNKHRQKKKKSMARMDIHYLSQSTTERSDNFIEAHWFFRQIMNIWGRVCVCMCETFGQSVKVTEDPPGGLQNSLQWIIVISFFFTETQSFKNKKCNIERFLELQTAFILT